MLRMHGIRSGGIRGGVSPASVLGHVMRRSGGVVKRARWSCASTAATANIQLVRVRIRARGSSRPSRTVGVAASRRAAVCVLLRSASAAVGSLLRVTSSSATSAAASGCIVLLRMMPRTRVAAAREGCMRPAVCMRPATTAASSLHVRVRMMRLLVVVVVVLRRLRLLLRHGLLGLLLGHGRRSGRELHVRVEWMIVADEEVIRVTLKEALQSAVTLLQHTEGREKASGRETEKSESSATGNKREKLAVAARSRASVCVCV